MVSGCPYADAMRSSILIWLSVMMGISAPGMMTRPPTRAFSMAVTFTESSASGRRTNGNASANARRFSLHALEIHFPICRSREALSSSSRAFVAAASAEVRDCASNIRLKREVRSFSSSGTGSGSGSGSCAAARTGKIRSLSGIGAPAAAARAATASPSSVTTMTAMPASRSVAAAAPIPSFSPATSTTISSCCSMA